MIVIELPPILGVVHWISGTPDLVEELARTLRNASATFDDLDTVASENAAPDSWHGEAAEHYTDRVRDVATDAGTTSLTLRAVARGLEEYGDELATLRQERDRLVDDRTGYNSALATLKADITATNDSGSVTDAAVAELRGRASDLQRRYDTHVSDVATMQTGEQSNDDTLRAVLTSYATMTEARRQTAGGDPADALMRRPGAPGTGASPEEVAAWWNGLTEDERNDVIAAYPDLIGSADGLPTQARDEANRILLENDIVALEKAEADGTITYDERRILANARKAVEGLEVAASTIDPVTGKPLPAFLHLYDPSAFHGDGKIAIAVGNPDTADNVTTFVPGMNTTAQDAPGYAEAAGNIVQSARLSGAGSTAAMFWIGYDHPSDWDTGRVGFEGASREGGEWLAQHVAGLQAARGDDQPHMTVIGHSYGSNTMAHAATDHGLGDMVDDLVFIGSPGAGSAGDASDLGSAEIWVGNASRDNVAKLADNGWWNLGSLGGAGLGRDVAEDSFGATRFQAESVNREIGSNWVPDHMRYWEPGSESLYNLGLIVAGQDGSVTHAEHTYDPWWSDPVDPEWSRTPGNHPERIDAEQQGGVP